jgi:hypothetical protein
MINASIAETPNAIDPKRFNNAICHERFPVLHENRECPTSTHTNPLATKKQIEPYISGTHT